jgi:hypothetical protein
MLLLFVFGLELGVLCSEVLVLSVDPLRDVGNQVQVMLDSCFLLLDVVRIVAGLHTFFFYRFLGPRNFRAVLSADFLEFFPFQLFDFFGVAINVLVDFCKQFEFGSLVGLQGIFFVSVPDSELPLQKFDLLAVVPLVVIVTFYSPRDFDLHFLVLSKLLFVLGHQVTIHFKPLVFLDLRFRHVELFVRRLEAVLVSLRLVGVSVHILIDVCAEN